ncbi:unnamed protein product, partial [Hapterophycus canaliculatus]
PTAPPLHATTTALSGWAAVFDTKNQAFYYHNLDTDETTWVLPTAAAVAAGAPGPDEPALEPFSKSPPELDNPGGVQADKGPEGDGKSSSGRGGGGDDAKAKSAKRSQLLKSSGEEGSGG